MEDEWKGREPKSKPWSEYPLGTKAWSIGGGHWLRVEAGWKWMPYGGTFPSPGADAFYVTVPHD